MTWEWVVLVLGLVYASALVVCTFIYSAGKFSDSKVVNNVSGDPS